MDQPVGCANCGTPGPWVEYAVCGCRLCVVCATGIVSTCPACHTEVPMSGKLEAMPRAEGDYSGPALVFWLFAIAAGVGLAAWIAR